MKIESRVRKLEAKIISAPIVLAFADGTTQEIRGPRDFILELLCGFSAGTLSLDQAEQLELIRRSESAIEPGNGRMVQLVRALMAGPNERETDLEANKPEH